MLIIYGKDNCKYCKEVINLLTKSAIDYTYRDITDENISYVKDFFKSNFNIEVKTIPQIFFIKEDKSFEYIGGRDDLVNYLRDKIN